MVTGDSPAGARRRVRLAIREARDAQHLTQAQVAEEMEWSLSKVMRIESGEVTITPNDLRPLLAFLRVTDQTVIDRLVQDARTSRRRAMWWDEPRFREHLSLASRQLLQHEAEAIELRYYQAQIAVPGALQLPEYAQAIIELYGMPEEMATARLDARRRRRAEFVDRIDRVQIYLLLDEAVFQRRYAPPQVLVAQFADLLALSERPTFRLRILHFDADVPPPMFGAFDLIELPGGGVGNSLLYRESQFIDELAEDPVNVERHRKIFEGMWAGALDEAQSREFIENLMASHGPAVTPPPRRKRPTRR